MSSSMENNPLPLMPGRVVIAYDATKDRNERELKRTVDNIRYRGDILHGGDTLMLLGVLHRLPHPSKCLANCLLEFKLLVLVPCFYAYYSLGSSLDHLRDSIV
ncbi:hypothetical protein CsSME_00014688 [Camellia sinensis var. sinensis]